MPESQLPYFKGEEDNGIKKPVNPKYIFGSILFFGVLTLVLGTFKIWRDIRTPSLANRGEAAESIAEILSRTEASQFSPDDPALKARDSDEDGLNDWDELNVFHTSPYLKDSDGDAVSDRDETLAKSDPNCPRGSVCSGGPVADVTATGTAGGLFSDLTPPAAEPTAPPDLNNLSAGQIRELLLSTGQVTEDQLKQVNDATLMQLYQETLKQQAPQP